MKAIEFLLRLSLLSLWYIYQIRYFKSYFCVYSFLLIQLFIQLIIGRNKKTKGTLFLYCIMSGNMQDQFSKLPYYKHMDYFRYYILPISEQTAAWTSILRQYVCECSLRISVNNTNAPFTHISLIVTEQ